MYWHQTNAFTPYVENICKYLHVHVHVKTFSYWLKDRGSIPCRGNDGTSYLRHRVQTCPTAHTASYPMGAGGELLLRGKAAGA
jgi:hypothetical protein